MSFLYLLGFLVLGILSRCAKVEFGGIVFSKPRFHKTSIITSSFGVIYEQ